LTLIVIKIVVRNGGKMAGISKEVKAEIIAKVKAGQKVTDLAKTYGISSKTIYNLLRGQITEQVS
jgi:Mor family transcriptional regulator